MKPKILSPSGDWESLRAAVEAGADAVYLGVQGFNMRANAKNFRQSELKKIVDFCHNNNIEVYVTLNTIVFENELSKINKILDKIKQSNADAVIAWDFSVIQLALKKKVPVHISTQMSVSNSEAIKFFEKMGIKSVNLARECSLKQIREIKRKTRMDVETFVHGAVCVSVSGRCFTSQFLYKKSANRGKCIQPCRRSYIVKDAETGDELKLGNNYIMSPKDLCALPILDKLVKAGIDRFKIEGRNRAPEYVKTVTEVYRQALDAIKLKKFNKNLIDKLMKKLEGVYNRKFSAGFFLGTPTNDDWTDIYGSDAKRKKVFAGIVQNYYKKPGVAAVLLQARGLRKGQTIMIQGPTTGIFEQKLESVKKSDKELKTAKKGDLIGVKTNRLVRKNDKVFVIREITQ